MMIVPTFWAEARTQYRRQGKQITIRRFGWSDLNQADAQRNAQERAQDALTRAIAGDTLPRREPKVPYNGATGVPIREEVVARHGDAVITRNSYGARCLNSPDVLFADIDFSTVAGAGLLRATRIGLLATSVLAVAALAAAGKGASTLWIAGLACGLMALVLASSIAGFFHRMAVRAKGGPEAVARQAVHRFMETRPDWLVHLYRTPAGLRLIATHRRFDPREAEVVQSFRELAVDPLYTAMCLNQHCFRARLSAKPWRIGMADRLKPRPGIWPVAPERLPQRRAWLARYDQAANGYAACRFIESLGQGVNDPVAQSVRQLHDHLCQVHAKLPIA